MSRFLKRLFGKEGFDVQGNIDRLKNNQPPLYELPLDLANPLMDYMLERSYLEDVSEREEFNVVSMSELEDVDWLRLDRLPV